MRADDAPAMPSALPLAPAIEAAAAELARLAALGAEVEEAVSRLVGSEPAPTVSPDDLRTLQELDRLLQHVAGLSIYLDGLAEAARRAADAGGEPGATSDAALRAALSRVKNDRLARALVGEPEAPAETRGEVELF